MKRTQILLTNDDGIRSPGLRAAAEALSALGYVTVAAPREQSSGTGRSLPSTSDGLIHVQQVKVKDEPWTVYAVGGTPAQAVLHAMLEILAEPPHLVVSGINYGENVGSGITVSGTIGAALEGAAFGIPSLAISLETDPKEHFSYSSEVDFSSAAYFTTYFARILLEKRMPFDVDVLKVDVPCEATPQTSWKVARLSRKRYFEPIVPQRDRWDTPGTVGYRTIEDHRVDDPGSDAYVLRVERKVAVTPISLDMTSRINLEDFEAFLRA